MGSHYLLGGLIPSAFCKGSSEKSYCPRMCHRTGSIGCTHPLISGHESKESLEIHQTSPWTRSKRPIRRLSKESASNGHPTMPEITGPREFWYLCWNLTFSRVKTIPRRAVWRLVWLRGRKPSRFSAEGPPLLHPHELVPKGRMIQSSRGAGDDLSLCELFGTMARMNCLHT
jgi:hypothetical protein